MGALTRGDRRAATGGGRGSGAGVENNADQQQQQLQQQPSSSSTFEPIGSGGGGGDAGLGDAAVVDSVYGLNALRAMCDSSRLSGIVSEHKMAEAAAAGTAEAATAAVEALLPPMVELDSVVAGVAAALEHLPASLCETDDCIRLLLETSSELQQQQQQQQPGSGNTRGGSSNNGGGAVRIAATRRLLGVTALALETMDLKEIGSDASLPGFAARPMPGVSKAKQQAAAATGVKKFLNRLLAKRIEVQVVVFAFFMACLESKITMAKVKKERGRERKESSGCRAISKLVEVKLVFFFFFFFIFSLSFQTHHLQLFLQLSFQKNKTKKARQYVRRWRRDD
jgi:hypothetical protein